MISLDLYLAKNHEISWLEDRLSELQENGQKKESDFTKKIQEKEEETEKAKKDLFLARENCLKKESVIDELSNELNSLRGMHLNVI